MSDRAEKRSVSPIKIGMFLTLIILLFAVWLGMTGELTENGLSRFEVLMMSDPNELGDTLAGIAGVFALLWIIVTAFHQSHELQEQRELVKEQKEELKKQVIASESMAEAMRVQKEFYVAEKDRRERQDAVNVVDQALHRLRVLLPVGEAYNPICWQFQSEKGIKEVWFRYMNDDAEELEKMKSSDLDEFLSRYIGAIKKHCLKHVEDLSKHRGCSRMTGRRVFEKIERQLSLIRKFHDRLPDDRQMYLEGCGFQDWEEVVAKLKRLSPGFASDR